MFSQAILYFFLVFLNIVFRVSCQGASLVFVIDDTRSMGDDINQIRNQIDAIMDIVDEEPDKIVNVVLVTFNDPDVRLKVVTNNRLVLKEALSNIRPNNFLNYDCPEMALSGVKVALQSSLPGSLIYVFSDASAKDYRMSEEIQQLCQEKHSQVSFVLTGDCNQLRSKRFKVYNDIASACSGIAFRVEKHEVETILHKVQTDIKKETTVPTSEMPTSVDNE